MSDPAGPATTTLFLARHGESEHNDLGLVTGRLDPGLSPLGLAQARTLAACLAGERLDAVYVSALRRTAQTAEPAATAAGLVPRPVADLDEMGFGELEGRRRDGSDPEAQALWAQWRADPWGFRGPGAERYPDVVERVRRGLRALLDEQAGRRVLLVAHRGSARIVLGTLLGRPPERWPELGLRHKHLYRLELTDPVAVATVVLTGSRAGQSLDGLVL